MNTRIRHLIEGSFIWIIVGGSIFFLFNVLAVVPENYLAENFIEPDLLLDSIQNNSVLSNSGHYFPGNKSIAVFNCPRKIKVVVTAYSSTVAQTDDTPYITASGDWVRYGIVAANFLPFGTELKIPEIFGNRIFVVLDRMHHRKGYQIDVWFQSTQEAIDFGIHRNVYIRLVEGV